MAEVKSERLEVRLGPGLLRCVDQARGGVPRGEFVRQALVEALGGGPTDRVAELEDSVGNLERRLSRLEEMAGL